MDTTPFHSGERQIQARAGEAHIATRNGRLIANRIPSGALKFVDKQPFVVAASLDDQQAIWVSMLAGQPGFLKAESPEVVQLSTDYLLSAPDDRFWTNVAQHPVAGLLFIELSSRKRLKVNGTVSVASNEVGLTVRVQEAFPLCPRYIQRREVAITAIDQPTNQATLTGSQLTPELNAWIAETDTFFVGSAHDDDHLDVGHRGGKPGFVQILDNQTLQIPDYNGNSMFNSLGNFSINPRAGLLFVNFETGESLQITGHADVQFTEPSPEDPTGGTGRYWQIHIHSWLRQSSLSGLSWTFLEYSPFNVK
ncbi:pyridoxamine 5'-phosphate oxidase family protein [Spirosoma foliorum]|uniref:Pyridoxamine 5'-phosphate oxidase family protein n=1 Tax=Spirosoma foliorum TaxID=2710596 RepID=A0A7G5H1F2_9BACT|nr:pyridoxamine 5'-phosphate oxidase family protein [Spirosoma foliorum]QMW04944.1 pyridoxamine 5'-phosphate oxidase family protein [Spirosoma foliorum]